MTSHMLAIWTKHLMPFYFQDICTINSRYNTPTYDIHYPIIEIRGCCIKRLMWKFHLVTYYSAVLSPFQKSHQCVTLPTITSRVCKTHYLTSARF